LVLRRVFVQVVWDYALPGRRPGRQVPLRTQLPELSELLPVQSAKQCGYIGHSGPLLESDAKSINIGHVN
jgi:hypothetical protein